VRREGEAVRLFTRREAVVCGPDGVAIFDALHRRGTVAPLRCPRCGQPFVHGWAAIEAGWRLSQRRIIAALKGYATHGAPVGGGWRAYRFDGMEYLWVHEGGYTIVGVGEGPIVFTVNSDT
jgi:hypothetical protein